PSCCRAKLIGWFMVVSEPDAVVRGLPACPQVTQHRFDARRIGRGRRNAQVRLELRGRFLVSAEPREQDAARATLGGPPRAGAVGVIMRMRSTAASPRR